MAPSGSQIHGYQPVRSALRPSADPKSWGLRDAACSTTNEAAEHFWPAWPNADCTTSLAARSRSADGVTMTAFLPEVSASKGRSGRNERNSSAVSYAPVRMSRSTFRVSNQGGTQVALAQLHVREQPRGTPASHSASTMTAPHRLASAAGLITTAEPAASAAAS